jgi:putative ABC transport system permease protein
LTGDYLELSPLQVALAAALVLINGTISWLLQLGLGRRLLIASVRTVVQLLLTGWILRYVFQWNSPWVVIGLGSAMACIAGLSATNRVRRRYAGLRLDSVLAMWVSSWVVTSLTLTAIVPAEPWYTARYAIPLLGMILGNTLNGISLGIDRFTEELAARRDVIETWLSLGATRWEAARDSIREAVRSGMVPTINAMLVVGIVSLPGMMTGQILAGADPVQAVLYQIVIMFVIAAGTGLGCILAVLQAFYRFFNADHQFLQDRIPEAVSR